MSALNLLRYLLIRDKRELNQVRCQVKGWPRVGQIVVVVVVVGQRRYDMRHEMLTQRALFLPSCQYKTGHAESAFHDACRTSSGGGEGVRDREVGR